MKSTLQYFNIYMAQIYITFSVAKHKMKSNLSRKTDQNEKNETFIGKIYKIMKANNYC